MFINISNHPVESWSKKQRQEAEKYGRITEIPFPVIKMEMSSSEIDHLVDDYFEKVKAYRYPVVMVQGEFIFAYRLVSRLKSNGIKALSSRSERKVKESLLKDGTVEKSAIFNFKGFMEY